MKNKTSCCPRDA